MRRRRKKLALHRGRTPATWQPRSPLAYSPMRRSCAGAMRGEDGERTSPPVTVW